MASSEQSHTISHASPLLTTQWKTSEEWTSCNTPLCPELCRSEWVSALNTEWLCQLVQLVLKDCPLSCSQSATLRGLHSEHRLLLPNFKQDPNLLEMFVQLIYAKFNQTTFSRFHVDLCWQADFVICEKITGAVTDTCGEFLKPSLGHLRYSYIEMRLC